MSSKPLGFLLAGAIMLSGCAALHPPLATIPTASRPGMASLVLQPKLQQARKIQAEINPYTAADVATLSVTPQLRDAKGNYTSLPGLEVVSPADNPLKAITLTNLKPNSTYRILAQAFDSTNTLISDAASSLVIVTVGSDDRPEMGVLPVKLVNRNFQGRASLHFTSVGVHHYDHMVLSEFALDDYGNEVPIPNLPAATVSYTPHLATLNLTNLHAYTYYRIRASFQDASNTELSSAAAEFPTNNDTTPIEQTLTVPYAGTLLAGTGEAGSQDDNVAAATFENPTGIAVDADGNVYVADTNNCTIRKITHEGDVTTLAGSPLAGSPSEADYVDDKGSKATFYWPHGVAVDAKGTVYVADTYNCTIRKITPAGDVTTLAGSPRQKAYRDGKGANARFSKPISIAIDGDGNLLVTDADAQAIRKVTPEGDVSTVVQDQSLDFLYGVAVDGSGNIFASTYFGNKIYKIPQGGSLEEFAGSGSYDDTDGQGTDASFARPAGIAADAQGNVYVMDENCSGVRFISPLGLVTTVPGEINGTRGAGIACDSSGNLYVTSPWGNTVRKAQ